MGNVGCREISVIAVEEDNSENLRANFHSFVQFNLNTAIRTPILNPEQAFHTGQN